MRTKSEKALREAEDLLLDAICQEDFAQQTSILAKARHTLNSALVGDPENPDLVHKLGLCWYNDQERSAKIRATIEHCFKKALLLDPTYHFAALNLAYFYFDEGRYKEALPLFSITDQNYLRDMDQVWRIQKNKELMLCCRLYLGDPSVGLLDFSEVCLGYEKVEPEDQCFPVEIIVCLARLVSVMPTRVRVWAPRVLSLINNLGYEKAFQTHTGYQVLQHFVTNQELKSI